MANSNERPGVIRSYYRSLTPDGRVWCETTDPEELFERSHPTASLTYERLDVYEASTGWQVISVGHIWASY